MTSCPHTEFRKGQKVIVALKTGIKVIDKYVEKKSGCVILKRVGRIKLKYVSSISIHRSKAL